MKELKVAKDRASQLVEKELSKAQAKKEDARFAELWEEDRQKKIRREEADKAIQAEKTKNTMITIHEQLNALQAQAERENELEKEAAKLMVISISFLDWRTRTSTRRGSA